MLDARSNGHFFHRKGLLRVIAIITLWSFLFTLGGGDVLIEHLRYRSLLRSNGPGQAWASGTLEPSSVGSKGSGGPSSILLSGKRKRAPLKQLNVKTLNLPLALGSVKERWIPPDGMADSPLIIHIQDAHCNYYAQQAVSKIISYIQGEYGLNLVNLEGGKGAYDLSIFTSIKDKHVRAAVADFYLKQGIINGAEYYAINEPEDISLWGIEDTALYLKNLKVYRESVSRKKEIGRSLDSLGHILNNLKRRIYSSELLELDDKYSAYKSDELDLKGYLKFLFSKANQKALELRAFTNLYLLMESFVLESNIDFKMANIQRDTLITRFEKMLSKRSIEELIRKTVRFRSGEISEIDFYTYLVNKAKLINFDLSQLPELRKYIVYVSTTHAIEKTKIMEEVEGLEETIKRVIYTDNKQQRLNLLSKNLVLIENLFKISLSKEDYSYLQDNRKLFKVKRFSSFIEKEAPRYGISARLASNIKTLDRYIKDMLKFYEYSFKRDTAFLKNIRFQALKSRSEGTTTRKEASIIVTGGFHSDNLHKLFKKKGISYVSIMPNFKLENGYKCPYLGLLAGEINDPIAEAIGPLMSNSGIQIASALDSALGVEVWGRVNLDKMAVSVWVRSRVLGGDPVTIRLDNGEILKFARKNGTVSVSDQAEAGDASISADEFLALAYQDVKDRLMEDAEFSDIENLEESLDIVAELPSAVEPSTASTDVTAKTGVVADRGAGSKGTLLRTSDDLLEALEGYGYNTKTKYVIQEFCRETTTNALRAQAKRLLSDDYYRGRGEMEEFLREERSLTASDKLNIEHAQKAGRDLTEVRMEYSVGRNGIRITIANSGVNNHARQRINQKLKEEFVEDDGAGFVDYDDERRDLYGSSAGLRITKEYIESEAVGGTFHEPSFRGDWVTFEVFIPGPEAKLGKDDKAYFEAQRSYLSRFGKAAIGRLTRLYRIIGSGVSVVIHGTIFALLAIINNASNVPEPEADLTDLHTTIETKIDEEIAAPEGVQIRPGSSPRETQEDLEGPSEDPVDSPADTQSIPGLLKQGIPEGDAFRMNSVGNTGIKHLRFKNQQEQARAFDRAMVYVEHPEHKGKVLTDNELEDMLTPSENIENDGFGIRKPYRNGYNFNLKDLAQFLTDAGRNNIELNNVENDMKEKLLAEGLIAENPDGIYRAERGGAIVSTSEGYSDAVYLAMLKHEVGHGLYETDPEYRKFVDDLWETLKKEDPETYEIIREMLEYFGYHESAFATEFAEYFSDPDILPGKIRQLYNEAYVSSYGREIPQEKRTQAGSIMKKLCERRQTSSFVKPEFIKSIDEIAGKINKAKEKAYKDAGIATEDQRLDMAGQLSQPVHTDQGIPIRSTLMYITMSRFEGDHMAINKEIANSEKLNEREKKTALDAVTEYFKENPDISKEDTIAISIREEEKPEIKFVRKAGEVALQDAVDKALDGIETFDINDYLQKTKDAIDGQAWGSEEDLQIKRIVNLGGEKLEFEIILSRESSGGDQYYSLSIYTKSPGQKPDFTRNIWVTSRQKNVAKAFNEAWQKFEREAQRKLVDLEPEDDFRDLTLADVAETARRSVQKAGDTDYIGARHYIYIGGKKYDLRLTQRYSHAFSGDYFETSIRISGLDEPLALRADFSENTRSGSLDKALEDMRKVIFEKGIDTAVTSPEYAPDSAKRKIPHEERNAELRKQIWDRNVFSIDSDINVKVVIHNEHTVGETVNDRKVGERLKKTVGERLKRIRDSELIDSVLETMTSEVSSLIDAHEKGFSTQDRSKPLETHKVHELLSIYAKKMRLYIVQDRLTLHDKGPFAHCRRGITLESRGTGIWLGEKLFTAEGISDDEIARMLIEEAMHYLIPYDKDHAYSKHDELLQDKLEDIALKLDPAEEPGDTICEADMGQLDAGIFGSEGIWGGVGTGEHIPGQVPGIPIVGGTASDRQSDFRKREDKGNYTPPAGSEENRMIDVVTDNTKKSRQEIEEEINEYVEKEHLRRHNTYGFIYENDSEAAALVYGIFGRLVRAYDKQADLRGLPKFRGKLFIVDSPIVNANVFAGHDDVYMNAGIIRELANYAGQMNISDAGALVAAVMAHEMSHIAQHSTFEGISAADMEENDVLQNEAASIRRQAENNADEGAITLLGMAGYDPSAVIDMLKFLRRISYGSVSETYMNDPFSSHPHAVERLTYVEQEYVYNESRVVPGWNLTADTPGGTESLSSINKNHIGVDAQNIRSSQDLIRLIKGARSFEQVVELGKIARYYECFKGAALLHLNNDVRKDFAGEVLLRGALDVMKAIVSERVPALYGPSLPLAKKEGLFISRLTSDEHWTDEEIKDMQSPIKSTKLHSMPNALYTPKHNDDLTEEFNKIKQGIIGSRMESEDKLSALSLLERIYEETKNMLERVDENTYSRFFDSDPVLQEEFQDIVTSISGTGDLGRLSELLDHPFALYNTYGKSTLDERMDSRDMLKSVVDTLGLDVGDISIGDAYLERTESGFYERDMRLLDMTAPQERSTLFSAALISYFMENMRFATSDDAEIASKFESSYSQEIEKELYNAVLRTAPELQPGQGELSDEARQEESAQMRELCAALISQPGYQIPEGAGPRLRRYLNDIAGFADAAIFSDIFVQELGDYTAAKNRYLKGKRFGAHAVSEVDLFKGILEKTSTVDGRFDYESVEANDDTKKAAEDLFRGIDNFYYAIQVSASRNSIEDIEEYVRGELLNYSSKFFRRDILNKLIKDNFGKYAQHRQHLTISQFWNIINDTELMYASDAHTVLQNLIMCKDYWHGYTGYNSGNGRYDLADLRNDISIIRGHIDSRPASLHSFSNEYLSTYVHFRLEELRLEGREVTPETAFPLLEELSEIGHFTYFSNSLWEVEDGETDLILGHMSATDFAALNQHVSDADKHTLHIPSHDIPVGLFAVPKDHRQQHLLRMFFDLPLDRLQRIAKNQNRLRRSDAERKGRVVIEPGATNMQTIIDILVLIRLQKSRGLLQEINLSSEDFNEVLDFDIKIEKKKDGTVSKSFSGDAESITAPKLIDKTFDRQVEKLDKEPREKLEDLINELRTDEARDSGRLREFLRREMDGAYTLIELVLDLRDGFIGRYDYADGFFTALSKRGDGDLGLMLFPLYAEFMQDMQIPSVGKLTHMKNKSSYLEALIANVEVAGQKAEVFKAYDSIYSKLEETASILKGKRTQNEIKQEFKSRISQLLEFFPEANLYRDWVISKWEGAVFPGIDVSKMEKIVMYLTNRKDSKDDIFGATVLMTPLQWEKCNDDELYKGISSEDASLILWLYKETIPLVADPERQLRMGKTAINIFRIVHPQASSRFRAQNPEFAFKVELDKIKSFFPLASEVRDKELQELLDRHVVLSGSPVFAEATRLLKSYQDMQYDAELANANFAQQVIGGILSGASREDRRDMLFWILDPKKFPEKPRVILQAEDKFNVHFDEFPGHVSLLPEEYRVKLYQRLFIGTNGLFDPRIVNGVENSEDVRVMDNVASGLFNYFFPSPKESRAARKKSQFTPEMRDLIKDIFPVVLREYNPTKRTSVVMSLLKIQNKVMKYSEGERLGRLLSALGPVGAKLGQYLSENQNLIANEELRSDLASLKYGVSPLSKLAVLNVLESSGFNMNSIKIGKMLGAASMKQVHEGEMKINGVWKEVVIKIIRPNIERTIDEDIKVLERVVNYIKDRYGFDAGDLSGTIQRWIEEERDMLNEVININLLRKATRGYRGSQLQGFRVAIPKVIYGKDVNVIIEEKAGGIEVDPILRGEDLSNKLKNRGFTEADIHKIQGIDQTQMVQVLRDLLLYQILDEGTFHADLHSGNVMIGPDKTLYLIDMGLIGRFDTQDGDRPRPTAQRDGTKSFLKGVLLHDTDLVFEGVKMIFSRYDNTEIVAREEEIISGINRIFKKRQNIKTELNDISTFVLQLRTDPDGTEDFSRLVKSLTQAIWLFPTLIRSARDTLEALSEKLNLTDKEKRRAISTHRWPVIKDTVYYMYVNSFIVRWKSALSAYMHEKIDRIKARLKVMTFSRLVFGTLHRVGTGLDTIIGLGPRDREILRWTKTISLDQIQFPDNFGRVAYIDMESVKPMDLNVVFDDAALNTIPAYNTLSRAGKERVKESIEIYLRVKAVLSHMGDYDMKFRVSMRESMIADFYARNEFGVTGHTEAKYKDEDIYKDLIARELGARIMARRYPDSAHVDIIRSRNPALRITAREWADVYLGYLSAQDDDDEEKRAKKLMRLDDSMPKFHDFDARVTVDLHLSQDVQARDISVRHRSLNRGRVSGRIVGNRDLKYNLRIRKKAIIPGFFESFKIGDLLVKATRTGFSENGRFKIHVLDPSHNEFASFSLTEEEFDAFVKRRKVTITARRYERWRAGRPVTAAEEMSPDSADDEIPHDERNFQLAEEIRKRNVFRIKGVQDGYTVSLEKHDTDDEKTGNREHKIGARISNNIAERLRTIREEGVLETVIKQINLDSLIKYRLTQGGTEDKEITKRMILRAAREQDLLIVQDRLTLHEDGPFGHARRGWAGLEGRIHRGIAIWLGEKLFTAGDITDMDIARLMLEEAMHIIAPGASHDFIKHSEPLQSKLKGIAEAPPHNEIVGEKFCITDMYMSGESTEDRMFDPETRDFKVLFAAWLHAVHVKRSRWGPISRLLPGGTVKKVLRSTGPLTDDPELCEGILRRIGHSDFFSLIDELRSFVRESRHMKEHLDAVVRLAKKKAYGSTDYTGTAARILEAIDRMNLRSDDDVLDTRFSGEDDNVTCGTICEDQHKGARNRLNEQLERQFDGFRSVLGLEDGADLSETQADEALVKLDYAESLKELDDFRRAIRLDAGIPDVGDKTKHINIFFAVPEGGTELFWVDDEWGAGHFSIEQRRMHLSLPFVRDKGPEMAAGVALHERTHINGAGHTAISNGLGEALRLAREGDKKEKHGDEKRRLEDIWQRIVYDEAEYKKRMKFLNVYSVDEVFSRKRIIESAIYFTQFRDGVVRHKEDLEDLFGLLESRLNTIDRIIRERYEFDQGAWPADILYKLKLMWIDYNDRKESFEWKVSILVREVYPAKTRINEIGVGDIRTDTRGRKWEILATGAEGDIRVIQRDLPPEEAKVEKGNMYDSRWDDNVPVIRRLVNDRNMRMLWHRPDLEPGRTWTRDEVTLILAVVDNEGEIIDFYSVEDMTRRSIPAKARGLSRPTHAVAFKYDSESKISENIAFLNLVSFKAQANILNAIKLYNEEVLIANTPLPDETEAEPVTLEPDTPELFDISAESPVFIQAGHQVFKVIKSPDGKVKLIVDLEPGMIEFYFGRPFAYELNVGQEIQAGRSDGPESKNTIVIKHGMFSREHFKVKLVSEDHLEITDLGSRNKTKVSQKQASSGGDDTVGGGLTDTDELGGDTHAAFGIEMKGNARASTGSINDRIKRLKSDIDIRERTVPEGFSIDSVDIDDVSVPVVVSESMSTRLSEQGQTVNGFITECISMRTEYEDLLVKRLKTKPYFILDALEASPNMYGNCMDDGYIYVNTNAPRELDAIGVSHELMHEARIFSNSDLDEGILSIFDMDLMLENGINPLSLSHDLDDRGIAIVSSWFTEFDGLGDTLRHEMRRSGMKAEEVDWYIERLRKTWQVRDSIAVSRIAENVRGPNRLGEIAEKFADILEKNIIEYLDIPDDIVEDKERLRRLVLMDLTESDHRMIREAFLDKLEEEDIYIPPVFRRALEKYMTRKQGKLFFDKFESLDIKDLVIIVQRLYGIISRDDQYDRAASDILEKDLPVVVLNAVPVPLMRSRMLDLSDSFGFAGDDWEKQRPSPRISEALRNGRYKAVQDVVAGKDGRVSRAAVKAVVEHFGIDVSEAVENSIINRIKRVYNRDTRLIEKIDAEELEAIAFKAARDFMRFVVKRILNLSEHYKQHGVTITRFIHRGADGLVVEGKDPSGKKVILKDNLPKTQSAHDDFKKMLDKIRELGRESEYFNSISDVHEVRFNEEEVDIVEIQDPVQGKTLRDILSQEEPGALDIKRSLDIAIQILEGNHLLIEKGEYVDMDIMNISNLIVTPEGRVRLVDFGKITPFTTTDNAAIEKNKVQVVGVVMRVLFGLVSRKIDRETATDNFGERFGEDYRGTGERAFRMIRSALQQGTINLRSLAVGLGNELEQDKEPFDRRTEDASRERPPIDERSRSTIGAYQSYDTRANLVITVVGVNGRDLTKLTGMAQDINRMISKNGYGVRGLRQMEIFNLNDPDDYKKAMDNAWETIRNLQDELMDLAEAGKRNSARARELSGLIENSRIVSFVPQMAQQEGPRLLGLSKEKYSALNITHVPDAYTDHDFVDIHARAALARLIADAYLTENFDNIRTYLKYIMDEDSYENMQGIDSIKGLLEYLFEHPLRIRSIFENFEQLQDIYEAIETAL